MRITTLALLPILLLAIGCGSTDPSLQDHSQDSERYAADIRELVTIHVRAARSSKEPADELTPIVNALQNQKGLPVGGYADIYSQLLIQATEAKEEAEQAGGRSSGIDAKLKQLEQTVEQLPASAQSTGE